MNTDLFRHIYDSAPDGIMIVARDGVIVMANAQAERQFGFGPGGLEGTRVDELVPESMRSSHAKRRESFGGHPASRPMGSGLQLVARRNDGSIFPVEISLSPVQSEGETLVISIIRDITERLRMEAEQEQLRAAAEMDRERQRIAMDLHDGIIQSLYAVGLQLESAAEDVTDEQARAVSTINKAIDQLSDTITDIRSYIMDLRPARYRGDLLEALMSLVTEFQANSLIEATVDFDPNLPSLSEEQERAIFHVAQEALNNARKHSRATQLLLRLRYVDGVVKLEISDNGQGFDRSVPMLADHHGLANMLARSAGASGIFRIETAPGAGTRVHMETPVRPRKDSE